ncbi:MAG TPA: ATP-grasp domain-containing protein [Arthrobacter sp.]
MTFTRLLVLGETHAPENLAAHLASAGVLAVETGTENHVPASMEGTALQVSTSGATRLLNAGVELDLLSPGPGWLATVPGHLLGRRLICIRLGKLPSAWDGPGTFHLAEQEYGTHGFETNYPDPAAFLRKFNAPSYRSPNLQFGLHVIASTHVKYTDRYRVFITHGQMTASTRMAAKPHPRRHRQFFEGTAPDQTKAAEHFGQVVADATAWNQPPGFSIDVGTAPDGSWQLIKAAPAWAADPLEANPSGVVASILAAQEPGLGRWKWVPDELFQRILMPAYPASEATSN